MDNAGDAWRRRWLCGIRAAIARHTRVGERRHMQLSACGVVARQHRKRMQAMPTTIKICNQPDQIDRVDIPRNCQTNRRINLLQCECEKSKSGDKKLNDDFFTRIRTKPCSNSQKQKKKKSAQKSIKLNRKAAKGNNAGPEVRHAPYACVDLLLTSGGHANDHIARIRR